MRLRSAGESEAAAEAGAAAPAATAFFVFFGCRPMTHPCRRRAKRLFTGELGGWKETYNAQIRRGFTSGFQALRRQRAIRAESLGGSSGAKMRITAPNRNRSQALGSGTEPPAERR